MRALDRPAAEALHQRLAQRGIQAELLFTAGQRADVVVRPDQVAQAVQELSCQPSAATSDPCMDFCQPPPTVGQHSEASRERSQLGCVLAQQAILLPGVARARVHLSEMAPAPARRVEEAPRTRAVVVAQVDPSRFDPTALQTLLAQVVPHLHIEDTTLITSPIPAPAQPQAAVTRHWAQLGPFRIHGDDLGAARTWVMTLLLMNAGVGLCLLALFLRFRSQRPSAP